MSLHTTIGVRASEVLSNEFKNLRCLLLLRTHHHHWAVSMSDHRVRDAAYQRSPHSAESPAAHDDQPRPYLLGNLHDLLGALEADA